MIGRPVSGTDLAFDRGRQAGRGPITGQNQIVPFRFRSRALRILFGHRRKGRPALAHDLPCGHVLCNARDLRDFTPDFFRQFFARHTEAELRTFLAGEETAPVERDPSPGGVPLAVVE